MFEQGPRDAPFMRPSDLDSLAEHLAMVGPGLRDGVDQLAALAALERVKAAAAAAEVRLMHRFATDEGRHVEAERTAAAREGRRLPAPEPVVGAQVALARMVSPARGRWLVEAARTLVRDLPSTLRALSAGEVSEERVLLIVREVQDLGAEDRRALDDALWSEGEAPCAAGLGDDELRTLVRRLVLRLDDQAAAARCRRARRGRRVTGRLLGDGTGRISAVLPAEQYGEVLRALGGAAASARTSGDLRTRGQVMADTLVLRVTGQDPTAPPAMRLELVIGVESLFGEASEPGQLAPQGGQGPGGWLPASLCTELVARASEEARVSLRRLFAMPGTCELVAMESRSRRFDGGLAELVRRRDGGRCRTPWCDAPIRQLDHVVGHARGGGTHLDQGQGLCEACNQVKETPGWSSWVAMSEFGGHEVRTLTPAFQFRVSRPPRGPGGPGGPRVPRQRPRRESPAPSAPPDT